MRQLAQHVRAPGLARGGTAAGLAILILCGCATATSPASSSRRASAPPPSSAAARTAGPATTSPASASSASPGRRGGRAGLAGFQALSLSFVSDQRGFALGTVGCGASRCAALLGTTDGGRRWRRLTAPTREPGDGLRRCRKPCAAQVRFATPSTGYAYDPSLLVTTDGGRRWQRQRGAYVSSLEAAGGSVVRVAARAAGCTGSPSDVDIAPTGATRWRPLPVPAIVSTCPPVLYRQGQRLVLAGYGNPAGGVRATAGIERSGDGGATWASGRDHCGGRDGYASGIALAPPDVLVLLCQHQMARPNGTYRPAWVRVSVDGGASLGPDQTVPSLAGAPPGTVTGYQLAAASAGRLVIVATGQHGSTVAVTQDGGRHWSSAFRPSSASRIVLVGWEDPRTGRIAQGGTVWTTRDGGRSWLPRRF